MHVHTLQPSNAPVLSIAWRIALNIECRRRGVTQRDRADAVCAGHSLIDAGASSGAALAAARRHLDHVAPRARRSPTPTAA